MGLTIPIVLLESQMDRLENWRLLQQLAGITNVDHAAELGAGKKL